MRTTAIAQALGCHPQTVRERIVRTNAEGIDRLGDRPGAGRKPRLTKGERSQIIALAQGPPPGASIRPSEGTLVTAEADAEEIDQVTVLAAQKLNHRAKPWIWGRPCRKPRRLRRRLVHCL